MKRSQINHAIKSASLLFEDRSWALPPEPKWDVTDFGLGWPDYGLVLVNLAEEPEYCEKLMFAFENMTTPWHAHRNKKEDIICRCGLLEVELCLSELHIPRVKPEFKVDGAPAVFNESRIVRLAAGQRITLPPGVFHKFRPVAAPCILGEVSTYNDDLTDNVFLDPNVGRFSVVEEDEPPAVALLSDV